MLKYISALPAPVASGMTQEEVIEILVAFAKDFQQETMLRTAVAGNGTGGLLVEDESRIIYARLDSEDGTVAEAQIDQWTPEIGDVILLQKINVFGLAGWLVLGQAKADRLPCF